MKRILVALSLCLSLSPALAQQVVPPSDTINCAYNSVPIVVSSGQMTRVQCGSSGQLLSIGVEQPDVTGTFTNATQTSSITSTSQDGYGTVLVSISGTYNTASGVFELSDDGGTTWFPLSVSRSDGSGAEIGYSSLTNINRAWLIPVAAMDLIRVRSTAVTSGTAAIRISSTSVQTSPIPTVITQITGNASGSTAAVVGTLAAAAAKTTYICDFDISAIGGTAAVGPVVVAGLVGSSKTYQLTSTAAGVLLSKSFSPCVPASAVNTAITITTTADGTASAVNVNSSGYQQ